MNERVVYGKGMYVKVWLSSVDVATRRRLEMRPKEGGERRRGEGDGREEEGGERRRGEGHTAQTDDG